MGPVSWLKRSNRAVRAERFPTCVGIVPLMLYSELRDCLLRSIIATRLDATVMPVQVSIFSEAPVPQVLRGWSALRLSLAVLAAQWFCIATKAWQSSTKSLFAPETVGLAVVSTKVPSVQLVAASKGMSPVVDVGITVSEVAGVAGV